jgi:O-antigen/teichoic acid export membrane protein
VAKTQSRGSDTVTNPAASKHQLIERYKSLAQNAAFLFALRALQHVLRLVIVYFVVRALSQESFGNYQFVLSCVALMAIFTLPGLNNSVMQTVARGLLGIYRKAVPRAVACSVIGGVILAGLGVYYRYTNQNAVSSGFFVAACLFPPAYGLEQWKSFRSGKEDFAGIFRIGAIGAVVLAVFMIAAVTRRPGDFLVPLAVLLGVQAGQNLLLTWSTLRSIPKDSASESGSLRYGFRTTFYTAFNTIANQTDKLLIYYFLSPTSLALFYAAERLPEMTKGVVQDVAGVLAPRFAKRDRYTADLDKKLRIMGLITGALIILLAFLILPLVVSILFGDSYDESIPYAQALMCSVAIGNIATLRYRYVASKLDEVSSRSVNIGMSLTRIAASLVLVPLYGILGAVISAFIYRIVMVIIVYAIIRKRYLDV